MVIGRNVRVSVCVYVSQFDWETCSNSNLHINFTNSFIWLNTEKGFVVIATK